MMSYTDGGPSAPLTWVRETVTALASRAPPGAASKMLLGVNFYGYVCVHARVDGCACLATCAAVNALAGAVLIIATLLWARRL